MDFSVLFFRDGTSIVLSDDFGQIHLVNTGQGESQKDAKYDQVLETFASSATSSSTQLLL